MTDNTSPNYDKTLMYVGLGAIGIYMAYKVFSTLGGIGGGGGGGGGGGSTCPNDGQPPGSLIRLHISRDTIGSDISKWIQSSAGYAVFQNANPNFASADTLTSQGYDEVQWTYECPNYYTVSSYKNCYFYPTFDATIRASYPYSLYMGQTNNQMPPICIGPQNPVTTLSGNTQILISEPDGTLVGKRYGTTVNNAVYGLEYYYPLALPSGVTPPNTNLGPPTFPTTVDSTHFYLFMIISVRSWRICSGSPTCKGWTLNAASGTNVVWTL